MRIEDSARGRMNDLRHTFATDLAERGAPESTMLAILGHMSRSMMERYSHIRMAAKHEAVAGITLGRKPAISDEVSTVSTTVARDSIIH